MTPEEETAKRYIQLLERCRQSLGYTPSILVDVLNAWGATSPLLTLDIIERLLDDSQIEVLKEITTPGDEEDPDEGPHELDTPRDALVLEPDLQGYL